MSENLSELKQLAHSLQEYAEEMVEKCFCNGEIKTLDAANKILDKWIN